MARGRFISKAISLDEKVDALSDDTCRLLFTWLIPHLDCEGRMFGDPQTVKSIVFPRRKILIQRIEKYLAELELHGLICRYCVNGNQYLWMPHFEKHQPGLNKKKEAQSQIPPITPELLRSNDGLTLLQVKVKDKVKVEVKEEDKDTLLNPPESSVSSSTNDTELRKETTVEDVLKLYREKICEPGEDVENDIKLAVIQFSEAWVSDAINLAGSRGKKHWSYIAGILKNWKRWGKVTKDRRGFRRQYRPPGTYDEVLKFHQERAADCFKKEAAETQ